MAASFISSKRHLLDQVLHVPVLSLAILTGLTISLTVHALGPAMASLLFVSLPHLWHALLSWITPPCLFVLLNGIIAILTATSASFSDTGSSAPEGLDFSVITKIENVQEQQYRPLGMAIVAVEQQAEVDNDGASKREMFDLFAEGLRMVPHVLSQSGKSRNGSIVTGPEQAIQESPKRFPNKAIGHNGDVKNSDNDDVKEDVFYDVLVNECVDHLSVDDDDVIKEDLQSVSEDLRLEWPAEHESGLQIEVYKSGSHPNPCPHHSLPSSPIKNNMRRSFSIDSAELSMSDEDFRKWIDDFISNKYAKLRSE